MPFEIIYFREADQIIRKKNMENYVQSTLEYVDDALYGSLYRGELLRQALQDSGWRENGSLNILEGRRYQYKGFKKGIALEGSFAAYEFILEGLFRLQVGFDKGMIETGILMLTSQRSEKSSYGSSRELAAAELDMLYPTISMPVSIALFDLGSSELPEDEVGNGVLGTQSHDTPD